MARGKAYSDETKAAVMAALLAGQGVPEVAKSFEIPEPTVRRWRKLVPQAVRSEVERSMAAKKEHDLAELIGDYLAEALITLSAQAQLARDTGWLKRQDASSFAVLHGVITDKVWRILTTIEPEESDTTE